MELNKVLSVEPVLEPRTVGLRPRWANERHVPGVLQRGVHIEQIDPKSGSVIDAVLDAINFDGRRRTLNADGGDFRDTRASDCDDLNDIRVAVRGDGLQIGIE